MAGHLLGILLEVVNRISENINEELPFDQTSDSSSKGIIGEIYLDSRPESSTLKIRRENRNQKEPLSKQQGIEKKTHRSRSQGSSSLPTNWDRYEEEEELDSPESASKIVDVVMPKSKGADFRHLVAEAQSHAEKTLEAFISLDELLPWEFGVVLGSMLAVRGEGILSGIVGDNFVIEDKTSANQEIVY
ncbi:hypothetical protein SESBI_47742 [Sesbania bispinosa]|nr:hypothetical protein SESBI_47742 [Sesbania bispinosa]